MNEDDKRLGSIIKQGKEGDIVIVGSPFSYARKRTINKGGQQNGPCCLRRFFHKVGPIVNPEYEISIQAVSISDYGNIDFRVQEQNNFEAERCISKITQDIYDLLKNNKFPFIFGGSKQSLLGGAMAFHKIHKNTKHILISGKPNLRRPFDQNKLSSESILTLLNMHYPNSVILFGANQKYFPKNYNRDQFEHVSYQQIRKMQIISQERIFTQAGQRMNQVLQESKLNGVQNIHVSLTVEAVERFKGSRDVVNVGLTSQEIAQIFMLLGSQNSIKMIDISQFNPSVEDYESSLLLVNLLYYFTMGWTLKNDHIRKSL